MILKLYKTPSEVKADEEYKDWARTVIGDHRETTSTSEKLISKCKVTRKHLEESIQQIHTLTKEWTDLNGELTKAIHNLKDRIDDDTKKQMQEELEIFQKAEEEAKEAEAKAVEAALPKEEKENKSTKVPRRRQTEKLPKFRF